LPKRKTKANELDDDFEYTSKENKIIDNWKLNKLLIFLY
jgi:hypothetical protein